MKSMIFNCFKVALLVLISMNAHGQGVLESLQSINQSNYHELQSAALGRPLHIVVKPPASYSNKAQEVSGHLFTRWWHDISDAGGLLQLPAQPGRAT